MPHWQGVSYLFVRWIHLIFSLFNRIQAGQLKDAYALLEERLEMEEKQLGMRVEDLADIYNIMSKCKSEVSTLQVSWRMSKILQSSCLY